MSYRVLYWSGSSGRFAQWVNTLVNPFIIPCILGKILYCHIWKTTVIFSMKHFSIYLKYDFLSIQDRTCERRYHWLKCQDFKRFLISAWQCCHLVDEYSSQLTPGNYATSSWSQDALITKQKTCNNVIHCSSILFTLPPFLNYFKIFW